MDNIINDFSGQYRYLSNFYKCYIEYKGVVFNTVEAAFQAAKVKTNNNTDMIEALNAFAKMTPSEAKKAGRKVILREDWEKVKNDIMYELVRLKFTMNQELGLKLISTGNAYLIEGNTWHDNYWGSCKCQKCKDRVKANKLGEILMYVREELKTQLIY